jgi:hypothetical protein
MGAVTSIPAPRSVLRGTDCVPVGSVLLTRCPRPAMLRTKTVEGETRGRERPWAMARRGDFRHASLGAILECGGLPPLWPRRAGSPAQSSVFAGNRYWRGRKRWQATALQDRLSLGGNAVVCLRSGPYGGRKENSRRTVPETGRSSAAGAQHTACPHAARYDADRIGGGSSQGNSGMRENSGTLLRQRPREAQGHPREDRTDTRGRTVVVLRGMDVAVLGRYNYVAVPPSKGD